MHFHARVRELHAGHSMRTQDIKVLRCEEQCHRCLCSLDVERALNMRLCERQGGRIRNSKSA